jgi:hypothetical protein
VANARIEVPAHGVDGYRVEFLIPWAMASGRRKQEAANRRGHGLNARHSAGLIFQQSR